MRKTLLTIIIITALFCTVKAQAPIDSTLSGTTLITQLRANYTPTQTLGYGPARDVMYSVVDNDGNNGVHGIYTDFTVFWTPGTDPSQDVYQGGSGINAEHVYPQSMGASNEPAKSDMHNLRPCRAAVNSDRGNLKFGESPDNDTDNWYKDAINQSNTPGTDIDEWSERDANNVFEPREAVKGDIARGVFYMALRYNGSSATEENIAEVSKTITQGLTEVRALSKLINPEAIKGIELSEALQLEIDRFNRLQFIDASLEVKGNQKNIDEKSSIIIFRILQEFFSNTIKHSKASQLNVTLLYTDTDLIIVAKDNGVGFSNEDKKEGIGLINIKHRAKLIGADVKFISEINKGTSLEIKYKI